ncbi:hypothetical protein [Prescottella equi]|uniref:hypothetical protein n=1 Tax=Rhodococcus hoagii TaxID=43767 RepID=UPI000D109088|nr:hypothetical protein [Prescottella equi]AVP71399.1 hypothetical protein C7H75_25305 [Prescottella equi]MCD7052794.1 hypothetical protein [Rhodococcus sp. BH2-1]
MVNVLNRELEADASPEARELHAACQYFVQTADALLADGRDIWGGDATSLAGLRAYVNALGLFLESRINGGEMLSAHIPARILNTLTALLTQAGIINSVKGKGSLDSVRDHIPTLRNELIEWLDQVHSAAQFDSTHRAAWTAFTENAARYLAPDYEQYFHVLNARLNSAEAEALRMKAELNEQQSKKARKEQLQAAGNTGASQLAQHFDDLSRAEAQSEANYMKLFVGCLLAITGIGIWILATAHDSDWKTIAIRAGLSLPIIAATTYVAKIAGRHREAKFWTRTSAVQLKTIGAYTSAIDDEKLRGSIYSTLGQSVFANPELASKADGQANFLPLDIIELVKLVTERAKTNA